MCNIAYTSMYDERYTIRDDSRFAIISYCKILLFYVFNKPRLHGIKNFYQFFFLYYVRNHSGSLTVE